MSILVESLKLRVTNQSALDETRRLCTKSSLGLVALNLTDMTFRSQIKKVRSPDAPILASINVAVVGDPKDGYVRFTLAETVTADLPVGNWVYDFNMKHTGGQPKCLWIAPFTVEQGVSEVTSWT